MRELSRHNFNGMLEEPELSALFNSIRKWLNPIRVKASWVESSNRFGKFDARTQVNVYDYDKVVKLYKDKIKAGATNRTWTAKWERNLKNLEKVKYESK